MVDILVEPTPNPNSIKFTLNQIVLDKGSKFLKSPAEAESYPVAKRLFEIPGVQMVFLMGNFISVTKSSQEDWNNLIPRIEAGITEVLK